MSPQPSESGDVAGRGASESGDVAGRGVSAGPSHVGYDEVAVDTGSHEGTRSGPLDGPADRTQGASVVVLDAPQGVREYFDPFVPQPTQVRFLYASWTSPEVEPGFVFSELVPSWHAATPEGSWVEVEARVRARRSGPWSDWLTLARWADHDAAMHSTSVPDPPTRFDAPVRVDTDTVRASEGAVAWQTRITLLRPETAVGPGPTVTYLGVMVSGPGTGQRPAGRAERGVAAGRTLDLPALSQRIHVGRHPEWGGGGDVWCSPTCVAMVLGYWSAGPDSAALSWVEESLPDRPVYHAVRHTWDYAYHGAGNWSFNAAYAARFGLRSFVTRLRDLAEAEAFIAAGIPLVASVYVDPRLLAGADYSSSGHLVVIAGFTRAGDVVVHDPGARDRASIRRVYQRDQFEHAWRTGSGGIVYIMHTPAVVTPPRPTEPNW